MQQANPNTELNGKRSDWILISNYGVDMWIAMNKLRDSPPGDGWRTVFAFMEEKYFTEESLRKLFTGLAGEYSQPRGLSIDIYSDEDVLVHEMQRYLSDLAPISSKPSKPENTRKERKSHFIARYHRQKVYINGVREEWFEYTTDPNKEELIRVLLNSETLKR
jgi:hypothetical protein